MHSAITFVPLVSSLLLVLRTLQCQNSVWIVALIPTPKIDS